MSNSSGAVALTQTLVRLNTSNPPGNEEQGAFYLGKLLEKAGYRISFFEYEPRRTSLVASIGGVSGQQPICFTGHVDTVSQGAAPWRSDPFAAEIDGDRLYGRGSSDMKSGLAAFVTAAIAVAPRLSATAGLVLIITAGEETGCEGAFHLVNLHKMEGILGSAGAMVVAEPTSNYPLVGHKGAFWLQVRSQGMAAHGAMPDCGVNAIYKAARAVTALEQFDFGVPAHPLMGRATLNVGTIRGGMNVNSVPDEAMIGVDIRTIPGQSHSDLVSCLDRYLGNDIEITSFLDIESVYTDPTDSWVQSIYEVMTPIIGEKPQPRIISYFTDAAALTKAYSNPPTVILGPGEPQMAHQTDEYCLVSRIEQSVDVYLQIIRNWCNL